MTLHKDIFITCPSPDQAVSRGQWASAPGTQHSLALPPEDPPPGGLQEAQRDTADSESPAQHFWPKLLLLSRTTSVFSLFSPSRIIFLQLLPCSIIPRTCVHSDPGLSPQKDKGQAPGGPSPLFCSQKRSSSPAHTSRLPPTLPHPHDTFGCLHKVLAHS